MEQTIKLDENGMILMGFITEGGKVVYIYDENDNLKGKGTHWVSSGNINEI